LDEIKGDRNHEGLKKHTAIHIVSISLNREKLEDIFKMLQTV
jgi:hypothetical protein